MQKAKMISLAVVAVLMIIIVLQNTASVETKLLFITFTMPRVFLLIVTFLIGFAAGAVAMLGIETGRRKDTGGPEKS